MPADFRRTDPSAVANPSPLPAATATRAPTEEVKWVKQFPLRLKTTMQRMQRFLHGNK